MSEPKAQPIPFIPRWLDELPLTPHQNRVLVHIWRRGTTYSNAATIATVCRMKRETVFSVLKELESSGLIRRKPRPGQTTLIEPVPPNGTGDHDNPSPQTGHHPYPETGQEVSPDSGRHPSPQTGHKGNPTKVTPLRKSPEGKKRQMQLSDSDFIESLKSNPAYAGISIEDEIGKMQAWLLTRPGRKLTRRFAINWLNRAEKPMAIQQKQPRTLNLGKRVQSNSYAETGIRPLHD